MERRLRIGLTGGIASGKSVASKRFSELGISVVDADDSARAVVAPGTFGLKQVIKRFGRQVLTERGELDRRKLRDVVFADPALRGELEAILHPLIHAHMEKEVEAALGPYVVLAIPLLVEGGSADQFDRTLVIDTDEEVQFQRLIARDATPPSQAKAMLAAQASRAARLKVADDVIHNTGTISELRHAVDQLHERYLKLAQSRGSGAELS
jgi:dephospho-CoA kinase